MIDRNGVIDMFWSSKLKLVLDVDRIVYLTNRAFHPRPVIVHVKIGMTGWPPPGLHRPPRASSAFAPTLPPFVLEQLDNHWRWDRPDMLSSLAVDRLGSRESRKQLLQRTRRAKPPTSVEVHRRCSRKSS